MERPALDRASVRSPYADQLNQGFPGLRFNELLEKEFRDFYLAQNLSRGRLVLLIALVPVCTVALIQLLIDAPTYGLTSWRLGLLFPLMLATAGAMYLPIAKRYQTEIAGISVLGGGLLVTYFSHVELVQGGPNLLGAQMLAILFACLFLGLLFDVAMAIGSLLLSWHLVAAVIVGVPTEEMWYSAALLGTAAGAALITTYKLEHITRTSFLETRLLHTLAERDGMTGLYNRRIFDDYAKRIWRQSRREGQALTIVMVDIDDFKVYNDLYGHQAGDDTLKKVAETIARCAKRPFDFTARYGGEEFVLLLYGPPSDYSRSLPEQIRLDVLALAIPHEGSRVADVVTVSVGVAVVEPNSTRSLAGAIQIADEALYQAKQEGRNRVVFKLAGDVEAETGNFLMRWSAGS
ncbi:MAG TPA: diguanylate cyclase [Gammaproteobacteria bacterium]